MPNYDYELDNEFSDDELDVIKRWLRKHYKRYCTGISACNYSRCYYIPAIYFKEDGDSDDEYDWP
jgi:hypothetical protein